MDTEQIQNPQNDISRNGEKTTPPKGPAIVITTLAIASFAMGFLLVHFTLPQKNTLPQKQTACAPKNKKPAVSAGVDNGMNDDTGIQDDSLEEAATSMGGGLPEVSPGPTPDGIRLDGAPLYYKCWAAGNDAAGSKECDRLRVLEKRMATRLYVVNECKEKHSDESDLGLLSLGANLDFADNTIKFWSGPSSTITNASKIGNCIRQKLAGLPLNSINHKYGKYRIFFSVDFFDPKQRERLLAQKRKRGRTVKVAKDKVNVREEPVDGTSLGRISSDSSVTLLKKNDTGEWCQVLTPSNREGWMICSALDL